MKQKKILAALLSLALGASLAACGSSPEPTAPVAQATQTTQAAQQPTAAPAKDSVVIAIGSEPETLDPTKGWGHGNAPIVQSTLVKYNADLNFENDLATDYVLSRKKGSHPQYTRSCRKRKGIFCMKQKKILAALLSLALGASLAACGSSPEPTAPVAQATQTTQAAQQPTAAPAKDSVVIAIGSEPETLDPTKGWGHGNAPIVQSTLVKYNADLNFENDLATDYVLSEDGLVWTFTIRSDAKFTDGEPVKASDVAFTLETAKAAQGSVDLTYMVSAEAKDDTTLVVTLEKPTSIFLNTLASVGIVPEHAYSDSYGTNPIGSGPYKFVEWRPQEQLLFVANEDYYGGAPAIKHVTIVFMSEDAALAAVQAGQVDVAYTSATLGTTQVPGYRVEAVTSADNRGFTLPMHPNEGKTTPSGFPYGNDVTCNLEIRQAIAYAIDRQQVADVALNGFGRPAYSENDGMPWNNPEVKIETDVEHAKKLLADAGWADTDRQARWMWRTPLPPWEPPRCRATVWRPLPLPITGASPCPCIPTRERPRPPASPMAMM